jgi:hypothetical protein
MRVARDFGLDPWVVERTWTNRQVRTANAWLDDDLGVPSRTDHYLMQLTREVVLFMAKPETRSRVKLSDFRLEPGKPRTEDDVRAFEENQKSAWVGMVGAGFTTETITRTEARARAKEIQVGVRT